VIQERTAGPPAEENDHMKRTVVFFALLSLGIVGCETQAHKDAVNEAEMNLKTTIANNFRELNDQKHETYVEAAEKLYGEQSGRTLEQCYEDGYDTVQNDDHTFRNDPTLGPKYVARCDKIRKALDSFYDKAEQAHQKELSQ
jgi:hypothetical protein